jgi:hypothetical protein
MNKIHEKSPCCRGSIWRRGERRRQCSLCLRTWRSWQKKKGRKRHRSDFDLLFRYLKHTSGSIRQQAEKKQITPAALSAQMAQTMKRFHQATPWPALPDGELILIADAMIEYINKIPHTFYFLLIRSINENKAVIAPFSVRIDEGEGFQGWYRALQQLTPEVRQRIRVLVCDGMQALIRIGKDQGWLIQRCQFHLRARISHYCSPRRFGKRPKYGKQMQKLIVIILTNRNSNIIQKALEEIREMKEQTTAKSFKTVLSGFLKHYEDYRTYLYYPEYHLPVTSNSAEFLIGQIRDLQYRARGFKSLKSLSSWIETYCKYTQTITCNGKLSAPT